MGSWNRFVNDDHVKSISRMKPQIKGVISDIILISLAAILITLLLSILL